MGFLDNRGQFLKRALGPAPAVVPLEKTRPWSRS